MQLEILAVRVGLEEFVGGVSHPASHRDQLHPKDVRPVLFHLLPIAEEVGEAQLAVAPLAGEREAGELASEVVRVMDDEGLVLGVHREIPVDDTEVGDVLRLDAVGPHPEARECLLLHELVEGLLLRRLHAPAAHERRPMIKPLEDVGKWNALDNLRAPERRGRHVDVPGDVGANAQFWFWDVDE